MNAPESGTIKEFLANEEDTVTVGQDLVRIETGGAPPADGDKQAPVESKEGTPVPEKDAQPEKAAEAKPKQQHAPTPAPEKTEAVPKQESRPAQPPKEAPATLGNREERRVSQYARRLFGWSNIVFRSR